MRKKFIITVFLVFVTTTAYSAEYAPHSTETSPLVSWFSQDTATGNWNGLRSKLTDQGITISSNYTTDIGGNPSGGLEHAARYAGFLSVAAAIDFEKLASIKGLGLTVSNYIASGRDLSALIGNFFGVQEIYTPGNYFFGEIDLSLSIMDDKVVLEAGRLFAGDVFATSEMFQYYVNGGINNNLNSMPANIFFPTFNITAWAARATYQPDKHWEFIGGVYNADAGVEDPHEHGFYFNMDMDKGYLAIGQMTYNYDRERNEVNLPGSVSFGSYYQSSKFEYLDNPGSYHRGNYGLYLILERMIYRGDWPEFKGPHYLRSEASYAERVADPYEPQTAQAADRPKGLSAWAGAYAAPQKDINTQIYQLAGGLVYQGLPPNRNHDVTAFCIILGKFSDKLDNQDMETVLELNHRFQLSQWFYLTPDIQYIINPNGQKDIRDALVLGVEASVNF